MSIILEDPTLDAWIYCFAAHPIMNPWTSSQPDFPSSKTKPYHHKNWRFWRLQHFIRQSIPLSDFCFFFVLLLLLINQLATRQKKSGPWKSFGLFKPQCDPGKAHWHVLFGLLKTFKEEHYDSPPVSSIGRAVFPFFRLQFVKCLPNSCAVWHPCFQSHAKKPKHEQKFIMHGTIHVLCTTY